MHVVIVTGLSGAGKSTALRALEDVEFYCVDNMPLPFVRDLIEHMATIGETQKVAIAIDARQKRWLPDYREHLARLRASGHRIEVMFLDSGDDVLLRRNSETRRLHPLSGDDLAEGIRRDRALVADLRERALVVDTSNLTVHQLKSIIQDHYGKSQRMAISLVSFGYKYGVPGEFNHVFDIRFLPNPYFDPALSHLDGRDPEVSRFVLASPEGETMTTKIEDLLRFSLPHFQREGKLYVTIAIGCTGGRHRSVAMVEELRRRLGGEWDVLVRHRDVDRVS
jgi:RNase adapter protein RapZ